MSKKVIMAGATGALGSKIAAALLAKGADVTALIRPTSNRGKLEAIGVKHFVTGDMMDKNSLEKALSPGHDFDAIVASAAGYTRHTKGDNAYTDTLGYQNLVDATKEAGIPRFVLISILECNRAVKVPHFYNKYLIEKRLLEKQQPFIALRPGAFLDQTPDYILPKITKGILPVFFTGSEYGMIYTPDLARYAAIAAVSLPDSELNTSVNVGWETPASNEKLAAAFETVLNKPVIIKPAIPVFFSKIIMPVVARFNGNIYDMRQMINWVKTGAYISKNTRRQKELFGDLPTVEEAVTRYCRDRDLIPA